MKIWEKCNEIKNTNVTRETIRNWSINNRICPLMFDVGLEINVPLDENGYPVDNFLLQAAKKACNSDCGTYVCLDNFLDTEITEDKESE